MGITPVLKFVFWVLLALNAVLFAYGRGYLGAPADSGREPARLKNQLALERITLLSEAEAKAAAAGATPPPAESAPAPATLLACVQAGPFSAGEARRFETRAARLELGQKQSRISVPFQEVSSYMVYLPPAGGKEGTDRRTLELKQRGIENFFVIQGESAMKYAISLGLFKAEAAARTHAATLERQGVRGVRILPRGPQGVRTAYQFRDIGLEVRSRIADIAKDFAGVRLGDCE